MIHPAGTLKFSWMLFAATNIIPNLILSRRSTSKRIDSIPKKHIESIRFCDRSQKKGIRRFGSNAAACITHIFSPAKENNHHGM
jgi:hypothetical protein